MQDDTWQVIGEIILIAVDRKGRSDETGAAVPSMIVGSDLCSRSDRLGDESLKR